MSFFKNPTAPELARTARGVIGRVVTGNVCYNMDRSHVSDEASPPARAHASAPRRKSHLRYTPLAHAPAHAPQTKKRGTTQVSHAACLPVLATGAKFAAYDLCRMGADIIEDLNERWKISPKMRGLFLMMSMLGDNNSNDIMKRLLACIVESYHSSAQSKTLMCKYYILVGKSGELYGIAEWVHEETSGRGITEGIIHKFEYMFDETVQLPARLTVMVMNADVSTSFRFIAPARKALLDRGSTMLCSIFDYGIFKSPPWRNVMVTARGRGTLRRRQQRRGL